MVKYFKNFLIYNLIQADEKSSIGDNMILALAALAVSAGLGFGLGRVKNASKLKAVSAEIAKVEASAVAEVKNLVAAIKSKL